MHLCHDYDVFHVGLSDSLCALGVDSEVVAYKLRKGNFKIIDSISATHFVNSNVIALRTPFFHILRISKAYNNITKRIKVDSDIIHAHMLSTDGLIAHRLKLKYNKKYIVSIRNSDINNTLWRFPGCREKMVSALLGAEAIIFLSPSYVQKLYDLIGGNIFNKVEKKIEILPNGISEYWFDNISASRPSLHSKHEVKFLIVGEVNKNKNQLLLAGFIDKYSRERGVNARLFIAGKISDNRYFLKLKRYSFVEYFGVLSKDELLDLYRKSDIFVMLSRHETFGLVYVEALTQGLPIIYTEGEGIDGYFPEGVVGYNSKASEYEKFQYAIDSILDGYANISKNCIRKSKEFKWKEVASNYNKLYKRLIKYD